MYDQHSRPFTAPQSTVAAVIRNIRPPVRWVTAAAYIVAVAGVALAAVTLTMFLMWKSSAETQITELRQEVTAAQQAQVTTAGTVTGLSRQVAGIARNLNAVSTIMSPFTTVCSTDLTGPNGPAQYDFLCTQHK